MRVVGPDCLLSASYDLHGNVSRRVIDNIDMFSAFRTAPHIDREETMQRSCAMLLHCIEKRIRTERSSVTPAVWCAATIVRTPVESMNVSSRRSRTTGCEPTHAARTFSSSSGAVARSSSPRGVNVTRPSLESTTTISMPD